MRKFIFLFTLIIFSSVSLQALEISDIQTPLSDIFSIDPNEGSCVFPSMNIPSGGRTEALGTAFTGLADDISFFDYNPAASAIMDKSELALFHNAWISDSAQETLAFTRRKGNFGYGSQIKCFYVPFSEYNLFGDRVAGSYYSETSATLNAAYNFLAGYTFKGLALGANLKGAWRSVPDYTDNNTDQVISGSGLAQSALAFMGDAGLLVRFNVLKFYQDRDANLKIGLALNNFGIALTGFGKNIQKDDDLPSRISAGLSYKPFSRLLISLEFRQPLLLSNMAASSKASLGAGVEITLTEFFKFQSGFLLKGANPRFSMGSEFEFKKIKFDLAYTLDLTSSLNPVNHISLSAKMTFGDRGRKAAMDKVDQHYINGLRAYSEGNYEEAITNWNLAIQTASDYPLKIRFEPAIEALQTAVRFNRNDSELRSLYSIK